MEAKCVYLYRACMRLRNTVQATAHEFCTSNASTGTVQSDRFDFSVPVCPECVKHMSAVQRSTTDYRALWVVYLAHGALFLKAGRLGGGVAKCGSRWSPLFRSQSSILGAAAQDSAAEINSGGATKRN